MVNKVILVGNVGLDPEVRSLEGGVKTARVRLATTERFYNRETQQSREHTEWHTIIFWRGLAEVVDKYVRKGSQIYIEGRLRSREWEDQNGVKRFSIEVVADDLKLLGRKPESAPAPLSSGGGAHGGSSQGHGSDGGTQGGQNGSWQQPRVESGEIGVAIIDGQATVKRFRWLPGGLLELVPENENYQPFTVDPEAEFRIGGKVVGMHRMIR